MIVRELATYLQYIARYFPVISLTGPRQSGKTTLIQHVFPAHEYHNLEDPEERELAINDPRAFLKNGATQMIIDEAQYAPQLFSYIQVLSDEQKKNALFVLSGSQNFLLMEKITQSLAGRVATLHLLPVSIREMFASGIRHKNWQNAAFTGGYPGPISHSLAPKDFYPFYIQSYLERDIRQLINVLDLERFRAFLSLCAGRVGQQLNFSSIGNEIGIDSKTASRWLSVLETSFIVFRLPQFHKNFGKRLIKSPKLYFFDTGLVCYLLGLRSMEDISNHYAKGSLFENLIITELYKNKVNTGEPPTYYYMRDNTGHEIDLLTETGNTLSAIEIKSGTTIQPDFFKNIEWLKKAAGNTRISPFVVYGGTTTQARTLAQVCPWNELPLL
jgi:uncharacterized protein